MLLEEMTTKESKTIGQHSVHPTPPTPLSAGGGV